MGVQTNIFQGPFGLNLAAGVAAALGIAPGSAGAFVVNGGALGTPSSGVGTHLTGVPLTTGITGILPVANGGTNYAGAAFATQTAPTVSAAVGSIGTTTAVCRALVIGKLVIATVVVTWAGAVTASGIISVSMPANATRQNITVGDGMSNATAQLFFCECRSAIGVFDVYASDAVNTPATAPSSGDIWAFRLVYETA